VELVVHLLPEGGPPESVLDYLVGHGLVLYPQPVGDVVVDALRERVGLLEHHPDPPSERDGVHLVTVHVDSTESELSVDARGVDEVVHPVDTPEKRRLPTARRTDDGGHLLLVDVEVDVPERLLLTVVDIQTPGLDDRVPVDPCACSGARCRVRVE